MEKRYQVFISSTFQDLQNARQEVSQALLRADCFPAGMELFPAADEEQFEFIKTVIDQSDYYIIISAGRYGSIHPETGLSYTEMEYDYAVETGKPVIRLLHKDPFNELVGAFIEKSDENRKKLDSFRMRMSSTKLVNFWRDPRELGQLVVFGLMDAQKRRPAVGWVRADLMSNNEAREKIVHLEDSVRRLSREKMSNNSALTWDFKELVEEFFKSVSMILPAGNWKTNSALSEFTRLFLKRFISDPYYLFSMDYQHLVKERSGVRLSTNQTNSLLRLALEFKFIDENNYLTDVGVQILRYLPIHKHFTETVPLSDL